MPSKNLPRRHRLHVAVTLALSGLLTAPAAPAAQAAPVVSLSTLDGSNGFRIDGVAEGDSSGFPVSAAGDVNGDGIDDVIIAAVVADPNGMNRAGSTYVVFGRSAGFTSAVNLSTLDGSNGFRLDGVQTYDYSGIAVAAAGDINDDGFDDVIISTRAPDASYAGRSYVVFGRSAGFAPVINLSTIDGSNGFRLDGAAAGHYSGRAVSAAGDINGDGIDDLIIGAVSRYGGNRSGNSYVVFGRSTSFASAINLSTLDGSNGFRLDGVANADYSGNAVSAAGDINGDGIDDLIIGAVEASPNGRTEAGSSFVVFGRSSGSFASTINLSTLNGSNGFRLDGVANFDSSGFAVSGAGDINGDGIDDLIISARNADPNGQSGAGSSYVVFGRSTSFAATIDLSTLDGSNGFRLDGVAAGDISGSSVSGVGDVNGDGIDDLIIGAHGADPNGVISVGSSYLVYGRSTGFASAINLSTLDGSNGFRLDGVAGGDRSGASVSNAGDINADGMDDFLIGSDRTDPNGVANAGSTYVVFGSAAIFRDGFEIAN